MEFTMQEKAQPIDTLGRSVYVYDFQKNFEIYLDGKRVPKLIEEAILFFFDAKGEQYVHAVLKEVQKLVLRKKM